MVYVDKLLGKFSHYSGRWLYVLQQMLVDIEGKDYSSIMEEKVLSLLFQEDGRRRFMAGC
jgi:hypothetical protein